MKIEPNMYVRTKYGIAKYVRDLVTKATIYRVIDRKIVYDNVEDWEDCLLDNEIIKTSNNIIDLIEVGDYVNGYKVSFKDNDYKPFVQCDYPVQEGITNHYRFYEEAIYSIVTKEQFSQMEYKVGD